jgi:hypothetical protein
LRPPSARLMIVVVSVMPRLRRRWSAGHQILPARLGIGAVKRAMLAIEVHRHRSSPTLDRHGVYGGLDLAAADRAHQQTAKWRFILGTSNRYIFARYTKLPLRDDRSDRQDGWKMDGNAPL